MGGWTLFRNDALVKENDVTGNLACKSHFVGYQYHGLPFIGQPANDLQNLANKFRIEG